MYEDELKTLSEKMDKSINALKSEFTSIRTGQANASLLDRIFVDPGDPGSLRYRTGSQDAGSAALG